MCERERESKTSRKKRKITRMVKNTSGAETGYKVVKEEPTTTKEEEEEEDQRAEQRNRRRRKRIEKGKGGWGGVQKWRDGELT